MKSINRLIRLILITIIVGHLLLLTHRYCYARTDLIQLTNSTKGESHFPSVNEDGKIVFVSNSNLTGQNPDGSDELFLSVKRENPIQLTNLNAGDIIGFFRIAGRRDSIVFSSNTNVNHTNLDKNFEIFAIKKLSTHEVSQITMTEPPVQNTFVSIDSAGDVAAYQCTTPDKDGFDAEKICLSQLNVDVNLQNKLTEPDSFQFASPTITSFPFIMVTPVLGNYFVAFSSNKNDLVPRDDMQTSRSFEIFTAEVDQNLQPLRFKQLTFTPISDLLDKFTPRISEEGNLIAYVNSSNRKNEDGSFTPVSRIDLISTDGSNHRMLYPDFEECGDPVLSANGDKIVFSCKADFVMNNPDKNSELFLFERNKETESITQLTNTTGGENILPYIDPTGRFVVWESTSDLTGDNPDGNSEIFLLSSQERQNPPSNGKPKIDVPSGFSFVDTRVPNLTQASFDISNSGDADLIVSDIIALMAMNSPITIGSTLNLPLTIEPGQSVMVGLNFNPTKIGNFKNSIKIRSNDAENPVVVVQVRGRGIQPELTGTVINARERKEVADEGTKFIIDTKMAARNTGDADSGAFSVGFFLSEDRLLDESDLLLKEIPAANLPPKTNSIKEEELEYPESTRGKFLIMFIDNLGQVTESNENNNTKVKQIR